MASRICGLDLGATSFVPQFGSKNRAFAEKALAQLRIVERHFPIAVDHSKWKGPRSCLDYLGIIKRRALTFAESDRVATDIQRIPDHPLGSQNLPGAMWNIVQGPSRLFELSRFFAMGEGIIR
ncbi:hypothetical protein KJ708_10130 [bacterium]|nr:hypothetical protein [bacterium]MBU1917713.1 hypothetical protein [bacterium]